MKRLNMKKHALCIIIALKLIILQKKPSQGWRKRIHHHCNSCNKCESWKIQKPRMKKHTNEPMTVPKPSQIHVSSILTNPFITLPKMTLQMLVLQMMMHKILLTNTNKRMKHPNHLISVSISFKFVGNLCNMQIVRILSHGCQH